MPLHPQAKAVCDLTNATRVPVAPEDRVQVTRDGWGLYLAMTGGDPQPVHAVEDRDADGVPVRVYRPSAEANLPIFVVLHGGGWVIGNVEQYDGIARWFANASGAVVVSVDYRLAPEAKFPAPLDDCHAATAWVAGHAGELGVDPARLAVVGDSAGGNLAAAVALMARDRGPAIAFQALIYPVLDHLTEWPSYVENAEGYMLERTSIAWFTGNYLASDDDAADWRASPIRATDLSGLPPALVITAHFDPLRDEGEAYGRRLGEAGVPVVVHRYEGMIHGFVGLPGITQAAVAVDEVAAALRDALRA
jgi:acetyl esterase